MLTKMLTKILAIVILVVAGFLTYVAFQPAEMNISRELLMQAKPEVIFPYINNTKLADEWMPWSESDPTVITTYTGPNEGVGSTSSWTSNGRMGIGQAVITESVVNQSVKTQLTYTKPMEMSQLAEITLTPSDTGTIVRWTVSGKNSFIGRVFCVLANMEKKVGDQFMQGLQKLKSKTEKGL